MIWVTPELVLIFAPAAALGSRKRRLMSPSLRSRPFKPILEALSELGATHNLEQPSSDLLVSGPLTGGKTQN